METQDIHESQLKDFVQSTFGRLILAYFWGPGCQNCLRFQSSLPEIETQLAGIPVTLLKINAYEAEAVASQYGIHGVPTFIVFRNGTILGKMTGFHSNDYFSTVVKELHSLP